MHALTSRSRCQVSRRSCTARRAHAAVRPVCSSINSAHATHGNGTADAPKTVVTGMGDYMWSFEVPGPGAQPQAVKSGRGRQIKELLVADIIRPLGRTRANDQAKVQALMHSIQHIGLQEPIDVLEVDGRYYGFSGCHRYEAHVRLGKEKILCRVRKANQEILKMHLM